MLVVLMIVRYHFMSAVVARLQLVLCLVFCLVEQLQTAFRFCCWTLVNCVVYVLSLATVSGFYKAHLCRFAPRGP